MNTPDQHEAADGKPWGFTMRPDGSVSDPHPELGMLMDVFYDDLIQMRESLAPKKPIACGCAHELIIARTYDTREKFQTAIRDKGTQAVALPLLCNQEIRENNPLCAHATALLGAHPLLTEVGGLGRIGLLSDDVLWDILYDIANEIRIIDQDAATRRWEGKQWMEAALQRQLDAREFANHKERELYIEQFRSNVQPQREQIERWVTEDARKRQEPLRAQLEKYHAGLMHILNTTIAAIEAERRIKERTM